MELYSIIAKKIIDAILKLEKGKIVSIAGEIHNLGKEPLSELELIEELALEIRKKKSFPILDISTERLKQKFFDEIQSIEEPDFDYFSKHIDLIDYFIDIGWRSNPKILSQISDESYEKIVSSTKDIWEKIIRTNKKVIFMGFPTIELAEYYNLELFQIRSSFFNGLNCGYTELENRRAFIQSKLKENSVLKLKLEREKLSFQLENDILYNDGHIENSNFISLPIGFLQASINPNTIKGYFTAKKVYLNKTIFNNVRFIFNEGKLVQVEFKEVNDNNNILKKSIENAIISKAIFYLGYNNGIKAYSGFLPYDKCIDRNVSLKLITSNNEEITISNNDFEVIANKELLIEIK